MSTKTAIYTALSAIADTHAVELPDDPTWPCIVFDIDTVPETAWVAGGGYDQHVVSVVTLAKTLGEIETITAQIDMAMQAMTGFMADEERGDAPYEPDPRVYGYFQNYRIRTRRT
jgi:hypothetical protein